MILPTHSPDEVCRQLMEDHCWITEDSRSRFKKELKKLQASGMSSKVIDYQPELPSRNRWFVSATLYNRKEKPVVLNKCCAVETEAGKKNYYIIRGLAFGRRHYVCVSSHVISRMKEREHQYKGMDGWKICLHVFKNGESSGYAPNKEEKIENGMLFCDTMIVTSSGVFLGMEKSTPRNLVFHLQTFIRPDMLYTYHQQILYRQFLLFAEDTKYFEFTRDGMRVTKMKAKTNAEKRKAVNSMLNGFDSGIEKDMFLIPPME